MSNKDKGRPPFFLFDPAAWNGSPKVRGMGPDQIGWFIQLLADAWESKDTPQATLPNDDQKLKQMSRFNQSIDREQKHFRTIRNQLITALTSSGQELTAAKAIEIVSTVLGLLLEESELELHNQWRSVLLHFKVDRSLIYSPRQMEELRRWRESYRRKARIGVESAGARWQKDQAAIGKDFLDIEGNLEHPVLDGTPITDPSVFQQSVLTSTLPTLNTHSPLTSTRVTQEDPMGLHANINNNVKSVSKNDTPKKMGHPLSSEQTSNTLNEAISSKKAVKKRETLFDESRFVLTEKMQLYLGTKYPEFVQGDIDYMVEKFKHLYYGKVYISWSRTFYNFVGNQVTLYGYKPGQFNWRGIGGQPPAPRQQSAAERNAEEERLADEYTQRLLQGNSQPNNLETEEALPLTAADIRDS